MFFKFYSLKMSMYQTIETMRERNGNLMLLFPTLIAYINFAYINLSYVIYNRRFLG